MKKNLALLMFLVITINASASCTVDESEPNNDFPEAQFIDKPGCSSIQINGSAYGSNELDVLKIQGPFYKGDLITLDLETPGARAIGIFNEDAESIRIFDYLWDYWLGRVSLRDNHEFIYLVITSEYLYSDYELKVRRTHGEIPSFRPQRILLDFDGAQNIFINAFPFGDLPALEDSWLTIYFPNQIDDIKNLIKEKVIEDFEGFDVRIYTTDNPILPQEPYSTVYFGGFSPANWDRVGVAESTDAYNSDLKQEAAIFVEEFINLNLYTVEAVSRSLAMGTSHEIGHLLGLRHVTDIDAIMNGVAYAGMDKFMNSPLNDELFLGFPMGFPIGNQNAPNLLGQTLGTWGCFDSDSTQDYPDYSYGVKGQVDYNRNGVIQYVIPDECQSNEYTLEESFCSNTGWGIRTLNCPGGENCSNGKCEGGPADCEDECSLQYPAGCWGETSRWVCGEANDFDSCLDYVFTPCPVGLSCQQVYTGGPGGTYVVTCLGSDWNASAAAGETVDLTMNGCTNCDVGNVTFEIFDVFEVSRYTLPPVPIDITGVASTQWVVEVPKDLGPNPEFFFVATLEGPLTVRVRSDNLMVTGVCGNGIVERGEQCDCGENGCSELELNEQSCSSLDFEGGSLGCYSDCKAFDLSNCVGACAPIRASFKPEEEVWPDIFGDLIVWESKRKNPTIYYYDISTGIKKIVIGENIKSYRRPSIYGDNVALERYDPITDLSRLWVLSPISGFLDTTGTEMSTRERFVDIFEDRVTYLAKTGEGYDVFVYQIYDVLTHTRYEPIQITTTAHLTEEYPPKIYGNKIIWFDKVDEAIYLYDIVEGSEPTELVSSVNAVSSSPLIFENNVVWNEFKDSEWKVFTKNISTGAETQIATGTKFLSDLDEDIIIWSDWRKETGYGTYMFDTSTGTETHLLTNSSENPHVRVHEKTLVWEDNGDIYYCKIPTCGNNIVEPGEQCDGNQPEPGEPWPCSTLGENWQGGNHVLCDSSCHFIDAVDRCGLCGNGQQESNEICDDSNTESCDGCSEDCSRVQPLCGDDIKECSEVCERGDSKACRIGSIVGTKKCNSACTGWNSCKTKPSCFLENTEILTPIGSKKIQDLKVGDMVMSFNEQTGKKEPTKVIETFTHETDSYLIINGKLKVTPNHPMLVNEKWMEIGNAKIGDKLKTVNGEETINSIDSVNEKVEVFNIEVEKNHNYYAEDYLAHNKIGGTEI